MRRQWVRLMFERPYHQRIAHVLAALDGELLRQHGCLFGGGTCIALRHGEYRESVDIDFLVSDAAGYRELRQSLTGPAGLNALVRAGAQPLTMLRDVRADQYGLRTVVQMDGQAIKFEIVREARIALESPGPEDVVCGIGTLTRLDLAMMDLRLPLLRAALTKATQAYGAAVARDLTKAIDRLQERQGWLERCMQTMAMTMPRAVLWQKVRALRRVLKAD